MTDDDLRLLDMVKGEFWARLRYLEERARAAANVPHWIDRQVNKVKDEAVASWLHQTHDPRRVRDRLRTIRFEAEHGSFADAWADLSRLVIEGEHAWQLATHSVFATGSKQTRTLDDTRNTANKQKKMEADSDAEAWQRVADEIWNRNPRYTKNAVARIIKNDKQLRPWQSEERIARKIQKPRHAG